MSTTSKAILTGQNMDDYFDFFSKMSEWQINRKNFPQEFFSIIAIFEEDCNFNVKEIRSDMQRLFIVGQNSKGDKRNELMLRYGNNELIVARVQFIHTRQGNMSRLYKILKQIKKKYRLNKIVVECCVTDASVSWCKKNGFTKINEAETSYIEK